MNGPEVNGDCLNGAITATTKKPYMVCTPQGFWNLTNYSALCFCSSNYDTFYNKCVQRGMSYVSNELAEGYISFIKILFYCIIL